MPCSMQRKQGEAPSLSGIRRERLQKERMRTPSVPTLHTQIDRENGGSEATQCIVHACETQYKRSRKRATRGNKERAERGRESFWIPGDGFQTVVLPSSPSCSGGTELNPTGKKTERPEPFAFFSFLSPFLFLLLVFCFSVHLHAFLLILPPFYVFCLNVDLEHLVSRVEAAGGTQPQSY